LPYITAALGLYFHMHIPAPWVPTKAPKPIIVYGAGSAVGAFAIKLLSLSNIHPIIAVCGQSSSFVQSIINPGKGDVVLDYRQGEEKLLTAIRKAVPSSGNVKYAFDAISTPSTINLLGRAIEPEGGVLGTVLKHDEGINIPSGVEMSLAFAPELWEPVSDAVKAGERGSVSNRETGLMFFRYLEYALAHHLIEPHPFQVLPGGLGGIEQGLLAVKEGKNSGLKYLYRIAETK
jgi:NADPH2:quinone reductase